MIGKGKYDDAATAARETCDAAGVLLVVIGGNKGHGFSVQAPKEIVQAVPTILRQVADQVEHDVQRDLEMERR